MDLYQYFILIGGECCCQILYAAHHCLVYFLPSCKTQPVYKPNQKDVYMKSMHNTESERAFKAHFLFIVTT